MIAGIVAGVVALVLIVAVCVSGFVEEENWADGYEETGQ